MPEVTPGAKRKKPPTFRHYPANRAKKLKQVWVAKTKIKSKWKAEKRRAGIGTSQPRISPDDEPIRNANDQDDVAQESGDEVESDHERSSIPAVTSSKSPQFIEKSGAPASRSSKRSIPPGHKLSTHSAPPAEHRPQNTSGIPKSRKERAKFFINGGRTEAETSHGRKRQPDMKLRMNSLLEKIQKDLS